MSEAYLDAKLHLDPSKHLATIHQHYRQDRQIDRTGQTDNGLIAQGEPFYKRSPEKRMIGEKCYKSCFVAKAVEEKIEKSVVARVVGCTNLNEIIY